MTEEQLRELLDLVELGQSLELKTEEDAELAMSIVHELTASPIVTTLGTLSLAVADYVASLAGQRIVKVSHDMLPAKMTTVSWTAITMAMMKHLGLAHRLPVIPGVAFEQLPKAEASNVGEK